MLGGCVRVAYECVVGAADAQVVGGAVRRVLPRDNHVNIKLTIFNAELIIFNAELIIFNAKIIIFNAELIIFNAKIIIFNAELITFNANFIILTCHGTVES